ncbi:response regulator transcription factor [Leeia oryzae]|uniref:response regulator transcription factor n=1 Tax=Leeia oryzae TaxID=356662 RepID=UPI00036E0494|nr:response regulator transcription factor [Leeia oryzae]
MIDDDITLASMLGEYLEGEGFKVSLRHQGTAGIETIRHGGIDCVVLDVMMPQMDGMTVLRHIRQISDVPVIMLTARGDNIDRILGLEMGADDYLSKPCYPRELAARIRAILRRTGNGAPASPTRHELDQLVLETETRISSWQGKPFELTATEFNLLCALLDGVGKVVSKESLSEIVLGRAMEAFDRSIDVHVSHVRQKLAKLSDCQIVIETVRGIGYRISFA